MNVAAYTEASRTYPARMLADVDVSVPAALIGNPARAAMLVALLNGKPLAAGELARLAGISPSTAGEHLARLTASGLTTVTRSGRHRYYTLSSAEVAQALECLQTIAPPRPVRSLRDARTGSTLAFARSCYDHLAGQLALHLANALTAQGALAPLVPAQKGTLLHAEHPLLAELGVQVPARNSTNRRPLVRGCLDWTERQPHLAGQLGAAALTALTSRAWLQPTNSRALHLTDDGRRNLGHLLNIDMTALRNASS